MAEMSKGADITKKEAVRRAVTALGVETRAADMQRFIKKEFGIVMSTDHISTYRADIRRQLAKAGGAAAKPGAAKPAAPQPTLPKLGAPKPMTQKSVAKKAAAPKAATASVAKQSSPASRKAGSISLDDLQSLKDLVVRVGAGDLKTLIDVLSR